MLWRCVRGCMVVAGAVVGFADLACAQAAPIAPQGVERTLKIDGASLWLRTVGHGTDAIVLHGGPDFDSGYLIPEFDRLTSRFRLVYYDQRGRGRSAEGVRAESVTLASDLSDLDAIRLKLSLDAPVLIGHSWGAVLALEYALRHPEHVSRLVLMNPAPVSTGDRKVMADWYLKKMGTEMAKQRELLASEAYKAGDPAAVTSRYRIHFKPAFATSASYERLMQKMSDGFVRQGKEGILKARAAEDGLMRDTWDRPDYDLFPALRKLKVPTLVIAGDQDFIPVAVAQHIANTLPNAKLVTIPNCGHFSYLECPDAVQRALDEYFGAPLRSR